jgi:hypothetical protein
MIDFCSLFVLMPVPLFEAPMLLTALALSLFLMAAAVRLQQ